MEYLRELCPRAIEISPGVYLGTCTETAFLISYPKAKQEYSESKSRILLGRDHTILIVGDVIYDPISDALGEKIDYWTDQIIIEEEDFSEWWTMNIFEGRYHPSSDFIADLF